MRGIVDPEKSGCLTERPIKRPGGNHRVDAGADDWNKARVPRSVDQSEMRATALRLAERIELLRGT